MSKFVMPNAVLSLPDEQQEAIVQVLTKAGLLTESGEPSNLTADNMPAHHKAFLNASLSSGEMVAPTADLLSVNFGCIAARVAEAAAIAACALVPGGPIVVAACAAAAHALADEACR